MTHRITFNKPATVTLFEQSVAVVFGFSNIGVWVKPVLNMRDYRLDLASGLSEIVVPLSANKRDIIEGHVTEELADRLGGTRSMPYFVIPDIDAENTGSWHQLDRYRSPGAPQKHHAWMRLWLPYDPKIAEPLSDELTEMFGEFVTKVRVAKARLDGAQRGRPTKEIEEARLILGAFRRFASEIGMCGEDEAVVEEAITLLRSILPSGRAAVIRLERDDALSG